MNRPGLSLPPTAGSGVRHGKVASAVLMLPSLAQGLMGVGLRPGHALGDAHQLPLRARTTCPELKAAVQRLADFCQICALPGVLGITQNFSSTLGS